MFKQTMDEVAHELRDIAASEDFHCEPLHATLSTSTRRCANCARLQPMARCGSCGMPYCHASCQRAHWKRHKYSCLATPDKWASFVRQNDALITTISNYASAELLARDRKSLMRLITDTLSNGCELFIADIVSSQASMSVLCQYAPDYGCMQASSCMRIFSVLPALLFGTKYLSNATRVLDLMAVRMLVGQEAHRIDKDEQFSVDTTAWVLVNPLHRRGASPALDTLVTQSATHAPLGEIDSYDPTAPVLWFFSLSDRSCKETARQDRPRDIDEFIRSARAFSKRLVAANDLAHHFLVVCVNDRAFIVQSFLGHYTIQEWCDMSRPLSSPADLEFAADEAKEIDPQPAMRGVHSRQQFWKAFTFHMDQICTPKSTANQRAVSYAALTGIKMPEIPTCLQSTTWRCNMQFL